MNQIETTLKSILNYYQFDAETIAAIVEEWRCYFERVGVAEPSRYEAFCALMRERIAHGIENVRAPREN